MKGHEIMDYVQRKINSILFRLVLVTYAILLFFVYPIHFNPYIYVIGTAIYLLLFIKFDRLSNLRLLNDFLFINLIISGKDPSQILVFIFLVLPIFNSINFSGNNKSIALYLFTIATYVLSLYFYQNSTGLVYSFNNIIPLSSIFFLWLINKYTELRLKIRNFREELNSTVDSFYIKKEEIKKPHKIYKQLIKVIQNNTRKIVITDIICFTIHSYKSDKLLITNGSSFFWSFIFQSNNIIDDIRDKKNLLNVELTLDGKEENKNLLLYSKVEEQEYVYVFILEKELPLYYLLIGFFNRTLEPAFKKISNILLSEKRLQEIRNEEIIRLSERSQYVSRANKTMHYIRNRLGPFSNLTKMLENSNNIPKDKLDSFKELIFRETEIARNELTNITKRANNMLEKSNNPFVYTKLEETSIEKVYTILKRNVYSFFPNIEIDVNIKFDGQRKYVPFNEEGFELFLADWLNNMLKYKNDKADCRFHVDESNLKIIFENDHKLSKQDVEELISDLTSDKRDEIMRRTTHGLYTIKLTLEEMNIPIEVISSNNDKKLILKLKLKTYTYENSSI